MTGLTTRRASIPRGIETRLLRGRRIQIEQIPRQLGKPRRLDRDGNVWPLDSPGSAVRGNEDLLIKHPAIEGTGYVEKAVSFSLIAGLRGTSANYPRKTIRWWAHPAAHTDM